MRSREHFPVRRGGLGVRTTPWSHGVKTDAKGGGDTPHQLIPYDSRFVGTKLWMQSAYNDSVTGAFSLSMGTQTVIEAQPPVRPWQAPWVYLSDPKPASGQLTTLHAPLQRLTFK